MSHLSRSDRAFLASVGPDAVRKLDDIVDLVQDLDAAALAAGLEADLTALDAFDDDAGDDPDLLDAIRADLRAQLGRIGRGEFTTEATEETEDDVQRPE